MVLPLSFHAFATLGKLAVLEPRMWWARLAVREHTKRSTGRAACERIRRTTAHGPDPGASLPPQGSDGQVGDGIICSHLRVVKDVLSRALTSLLGRA